VVTKAKGGAGDVRLVLRVSEVGKRWWPLRSIEDVGRGEGRRCSGLARQRLRCLDHGWLAGGGRGRMGWCRGGRTAGQRDGGGIASITGGGRGQRGQCRRVLPEEEAKEGG
jgi:hypothetical protein